jgi:hypothetical protein
MVSSFQRFCWLVVTVVLALGSPLVANAGMISTQLVDTDTAFANAIFENAFTDDVTEGYGCEYKTDSNLCTVMQSRLDCVSPRTEEESNNILPGVNAGGNVLGGFLRHDVGLVLLGNRAGNSISDELMAPSAKESCDHCCSLNLGSMELTPALGLRWIFPQVGTINPENSPLNVSFNENQPVSLPYPLTGRFKVDLRAIATICQQRWAWSTHQSGSDSAARYQCLAIARTSAGNVHFNYGLG